MDSKGQDIPAHLNELTQQIIGAAIEVHRALGPGLLERSYQLALLHELALREVFSASEVAIEIEYKGIVLPGHRLDLVVASAIVVELKAVEQVADTHLAQLVSYLRAGRYPIGLLINFNVPVLTKGVFRRVNSAALAHVSAFSATSASDSASLRSPSGGSP